MDTGRMPKLVFKTHLQAGSSRQTAELLLEWAANQADPSSVKYLVAIDAHDTEADGAVALLREWSYQDGSPLDLHVALAAYQDPAHAMNRDVDALDSTDWEYVMFSRCNAAPAAYGWDSVVAANAFGFGRPALLFYGSGAGIAHVGEPLTPVVRRDLFEALGYAYDPAPGADLGPASCSTLLSVSRGLGSCVFVPEAISMLAPELPAPVSWAGHSFTVSMPTNFAATELARVRPMIQKRSWSASSSPALSLLVCTVPQRADTLRKLMASLRPQIENFHRLAGSQGLIEVLVDSTEAGLLSIGRKRQKLLSECKGSYAAFIDDDDLVAPGYIDAVMAGLTHNVDCVDMHLTHVEGERRTKVTRHSLQYPQWNKPNGCLPPYHLNPVRTELALQAGFDDSNSDEDRRFGERLIDRKLLGSEAQVQQPLYVYNFNPTQSISRGRHSKLEPVREVDAEPKTARRQPASGDRYTAGRYNKR